jgi:hypothetical protein
VDLRTAHRFKRDKMPIHPHTWPHQDLVGAKVSGFGREPDLPVMMNMGAARSRLAADQWLAVRQTLPELNATGIAPSKRRWPAPDDTAERPWRVHQLSSQQPQRRRSVNTILSLFVRSG